MFTFPPPIMGYICNWFFIMILINTISKTISASLLKYYCSTIITTLTLGSRPRQGLTKVRAKKEAQVSHLMLSRV